MLHFDVKLDIRLQSYEVFVNVKNNVKQKNLNPVFANISNHNIADIRLIPLDQVTYMVP